MGKYFKIILSLVFVSFAVIAHAMSPVLMQGFGSSVDSCSIGSYDATGNYATNDDDSNLTAADAHGQSFQLGSAGNLAQICVNIAHGTTGTFEMRIDSEKDMSNGVIEDLGTSASVTGSGWVCIESATNPSLTGSTTYYIGIEEVSGGLAWYYNTGGGYASGTGTSGSTGWVLGGDATMDYNFRVYLCE